ncbi:hypothetical protein Tco_1096874 [Tanacetum coccineum]
MESWCQTLGAKLQKWCHVSKMKFGTRNAMAPEFSGSGLALRILVQSPKTRNSNKPVELKIHTQKPGKQIVTGHRFSPNKSFAVHEKTNTPRSCLRWIPTGRIFNTVGLSLEPALHEMTPATISSGLVPNPPPLTSFVPPSRSD